MKTIIIDYDTLKNYYFVSNFKEPITTEVYYTMDDDGWDLEFHKNNCYIHCRVTKTDLWDELPVEAKEEDKQAKINAFEITYLRKAVKVVSIKEIEISYDKKPDEPLNPSMPTYEDPMIDTVVKE